MRRRRRYRRNNRSDRRAVVAINKKQMRDIRLDLADLVRAREALPCSADDCDKRTTNRKPYYTEHVHLMAYVKELNELQSSRTALRGCSN